MGFRQEHFRMFSLYNRWANLRVYQVAAECAVEELARERGAYFKSILGTLNHLVVTDRMWLKRMAGVNPQAVKLDEILFADLPLLTAARRTLDQEIIEHVYSLTEADIESEMAYTTTSGASQTQPRQQVLAHVFNHQTHHRGQTHDLLGQALGAEKTPVLDLLYYQRVVARADVP